MEMEIVINIKQEYDENDKIDKATVVQLDHSYPICYDDCNRAAKMKIGGKEHGVVSRKIGKRSFICYHCNLIVHSKKDLINHLSVGDCRLKRHVVDMVSSVSSRMHHCKNPESGCSVEQMPNNQREYKFNKKRALENHVRNHEELITPVSSKIHQCRYCTYKTAILYHLSIHMSKHPESGCCVRKRRVKKVQCVHCDATLSNRRNLNNHIIKNHEEFIACISSKIHQCKHCSYKTTLSSSLASHMKKHPESGCSVKRMQCFYCDATFTTKCALHDHVLKNHEDFVASVSSKIHQCEHCSYKTTSSSNLSRHMAIHIESGYNVECSPCIHCNAIFKSIVALDDHIVKNHEKFIDSVSSKIYQCKHCSYKTTISFNLSSHMIKHPEFSLGDKPMQCINCDEVFDNKKDLDDHVIKNHEEFVASDSSKIHQCKYCTYKTTIWSYLTRHMRTHPEYRCVERVQCIHCDATFNKKIYLDDHVIKKHEEFVASVSHKIHQCKHCSYRTTIPCSLARHMTKHSESGCSVGRVHCIHCDATFNKKIYFEDHVIKNHKELVASISNKIHQCKHCSYRTTISCRLAKHMTIHPEYRCSVKQLPCMHCDATFNKKIYLDDHVIKKHKKFVASISHKIHQCKRCSYKTTIPCSLARHMTIHPESRCSVKQLPCIHCDAIFNNKSALNDHFIKNHKEFIVTGSPKIHQ